QPPLVPSPGSLELPANLLFPQATALPRTRILCSILARADVSCPTRHVAAESKHGKTEISTREAPVGGETKEDLCINFIALFYARLPCFHSRSVRRRPSGAGPGILKAGGVRIRKLAPMPGGTAAFCQLVVRDAMAGGALARSTPEVAEAKF